MLRILINALVIVALTCWPVCAKRYSGSEWVDDGCNYYNGSAWVNCTKNWYSGSAWVEIEAAATGTDTVTYENAGSIAHVEAGTSVTVTPGIGDTGDLLILACADDTNQALNSLDGFTLITSVSSSSSRLSVAYQTDAGDPSYTIGVPASTELTCGIIRLSKDSGTWAIQDNDSVSALASTSVTATSVTASKGDSILLVFYGNDDPQMSSTEPTGVTNAISYEVADSDPYLWAYYDAVDTGATSTHALSVGGVSDLSAISIVVEAQ